MNAEVVLVPGLWMPAAVMLLLAAHLERAGYRVHRFGYRGRDPLDANIERLASFARGSLMHFVGHSLGGVLIYDMLERHRDIAAGRVVLIGSPVRGSFAGRRFGSRSLGRWMLGGCSPRWQEREARWQRPEPLGVIAGTMAFGLGRAIGRLPGDNDGVVCVEETRIDGMVARALLPQGHSRLLVSQSVAGLVERFLGTGRFS